MPNDNKPPFAFLNPLRQQSFRFAAQSANNYHQASLTDSTHIYERMSNRDKAFGLRGWTVAHILDAFAGDDGAIGREVWNISGIEFDKAYFVYFRKISDPNQPIIEPKRITEARNAKYQTRLWDLEPEEQEPTPLSEFYPIIAGYIMQEGIITAIYLMNQVGSTVLSHQLIEISNIEARQQHEVKEPPKPTLALKPEFKKKDQQS